VSSSLHPDLAAPPPRHVSDACLRAALADGKVRAMMKYASAPFAAQLGGDQSWNSCLHGLYKALRLHDFGRQALTTSVVYFCRKQLLTDLDRFGPAPCRDPLGLSSPPDASGYQLLEGLGDFQAWLVREVVVYRRSLRSLARELGLSSRKISRLYRQAIEEARNG